MQMTRTWRTAFVDEPMRIAIGQPHQVLISGMSITFTAAFFYDALHKLPFLHPIAAGVIAVLGAIGAEYAYLKGLADSGTTQSPWQARLIWTVFSLLVISGVMVMLRYAYPVPALVSPSMAVATLLTLAHIVPLAMLGLCSAKLHAEAEARHAAEAEARRLEAVERERAERERAKRLQADEDDRARKKAEALEAIQVERARKLAEIEALEAATEARRRLRVAAQAPAHDPHDPPAQAPAHDPHAAAQRQMSRDELYAAVRAALAADPQFSRADMARRSGWSEAMIRKAIKEVA